MSFAKPEWLLCLIALPLIGLMAWLSWKKRGDRWKKMVSPRLRGRLSHTRPSWVHFSSLGLALAGMVGLIIAIAQPESGEEWIEIENEGRNILFCVDISRSMLARDVEPNRLGASRAAALEILERFPNDRGGVLLFSGETLIQSPLTIDHSFVEQTLAQLDPNDIPVGGSNLTIAVSSGTQLLMDTGQQSNIMVVFSDGEKSSEGLKEAAAAAAEKGIFIYAIGMGTSEGSFIPDPREPDGNFRDRSGNVVFSKLNEEALEILAKETNGYYSKGMGAGFIGKLNSALTEMDRFREEGKYQRVAKPAYRWFVFGGLLLIMTSIFIKCLPVAPVVTLATLILTMPRAKADLLEDAIIALKAGEITTAQQLFNGAAENTSGERAARLYLAAGSTASKAQDWPTAVAAFSSALTAQDPEILQQAHYALATSLFYMGAPKTKEDKIKAWKGSIEHFEASLEIVPDDQPSADNLRSVQRLLAETQKQKRPDEKENQRKDNGSEEDQKTKPEGSEQTSDQNQDERAEKKDSPQKTLDNKDPEKAPEDSLDQKENSDDNDNNQSKKNKADNQRDESRDDQGKEGNQSDESTARNTDSDSNKNKGNTERSESGDDKGSKAERFNLKNDPNAPENETPRERARRLLKQYSDFGGKAPRRIRRPYNRSPHDW